MSIVSKSCIFYLVNEHPIHLRRLKSSLKLLSNNFTKKFPYPIVFGHEGISSAVADFITSAAPRESKLYFHQVDFKLRNYPDSILKQIPEKFKWDGMWDAGAYFSMGYRHMCRLFSGGLYLDSFFENVEYIMRLDCDSYILDSVKEDPFQVMADRDAVYGYVDTFNDDPNVISGLYEFCNRIAPTDRDIKHNGAYETNFFVEKCEWFRSDKWMNFFRSIDDSGNIYIKRWGDAPIKYQGVNRLVHADKIIKINLPYRHGGDYCGSLTL